jgi:putative transposase
MSDGAIYLLQHFTHKAARAGRAIVLVDPRFTSKTYSNCGHVFEHLTLANRWVVCDCGLSLDRDHNAAINIRNRAGHARWGVSSPRGGLPQEATDL